MAEAESNDTTTEATKDDTAKTKTGDEQKKTSISGKSLEATKSDDRATAEVLTGQLTGGDVAADPARAAATVADAHDQRINAARELGSQDPPKPGPRVRERGEDPNQVPFSDNRIEKGRALQAARGSAYTVQAKDSDQPFQITEPREARAVASTG